MTSTVRRLGTIDWVDLTTRDIDAALDFYAQELGWTYQSSDSPMGTYHIALAGGHQAAGLMAPEPGVDAPPSWTVFVRVSDAHETATAIGNAGGLVLVEPFEIPGGALVAVAADPAGAVFSLMSGGPQPDVGEPSLRRAEHGAVAWCELLSRDPHAVVGFYDQVFGWQSTLDPASGYTTFRLDDLEVGGLLPMPAEVPAAAPSSWLVYFHVTDVATAEAAAAAAGGSVLRPLTTVGAMTFAVLADVVGATFGVLAL